MIGAHIWWHWFAGAFLVSTGWYIGRGVVAALGTVMALARRTRA